MFEILEAPTKMKGVLVIRLAPFEDSRGRFVELYNQKSYAEALGGLQFVEDDISVSRKNVLRGLHCDRKAWKLVSCLHGKVYVVVANCNHNSPYFGQWMGLTIEGEAPVQILIPPFFALGHLVISGVAVFHYKQSEYYSLERQSTYRYDNSSFGIKWPVDNPILSKRDTLGRAPDD